MDKEDFFSTEHLKSDLKKRAVRGAGATVFSQVFNFFLHLASTMVLARLLTPEDFGLFAMVTTFSLLLMNFGLNGFTEAIIQREQIDHGTVSTLFWINLFISIALTVIFISLAVGIAAFFSEPRLKLISIAVSLSIILNSLSTIHLALLQRKMQFYIVAVISLVARVISFAVAIILAWLGWNYWALVVSFLVMPAATAAGAWIYCRWKPGLPARGTQAMSMLKFALNTYGNFTMNYFSRNLDKLLVGKYFGSFSLGYYKKAYDLFALAVNQLTSPLTTVAVAAMSRLVYKPEKYCDNYLKAVSMIAFVGMAIGAGLTITGKDLVRILLGPQWDEAGEIFTFFGPGIGIMLIYGTHGWLHLSLGRADRWFRWGVMEFIVTAALFFMGLGFGPSGVAFAWTASFYVLLAPGLWYAGRPINLEIKPVLFAIFKYWISAAATVLLSWLIIYSFESTAQIFAGMNVFVRFFSSSIFCLLIYMIILIVFFHGLHAMRQFTSLLSEMVPELRQKKLNQPEARNKPEFYE